MSGTPEKFRSISLFSISADEPLPFRLAIFYKGRHLVYRKPGQAFESHFYNKFVYRRIHRIFVPDEDYEVYLAYVKAKTEQEQKLLNDKSLSKDQVEQNKVLLNLKSVSQKLFGAEDENAMTAVVEEAMMVSKSAVETVLSKPYIEVYNSLSLKANTVADHSMRVCVLSTFLGYHLGFVNPVALEHMAAASLLHDIGKTKLTLSDAFDGNEKEEEDNELLKQHPIVSCEMLAKNAFVPQEVLRIIREHHEGRDGSGYPTGMRGPKMYGLSKVFVIANTFDNLASAPNLDPSKRSENYLAASKTMLTDLRNQFDATLLPKALRLLTHTMKL